MYSEYGWQVRCLDLADEPEFDDCRSIERIGFHVANSVRKEAVDITAAKIRAENSSGYFIEVNDEPIPLQPAGHEDQNYVRTYDTDRSDDPLLSLPTCTDYESRW